MPVVSWTEMRNVRNCTTQETPIAESLNSLGPPSMAHRKPSSPSLRIHIVDLMFGSDSIETFRTLKILIQIAEESE